MVPKTRHIEPTQPWFRKGIPKLDQWLGHILPFKAGRHSRCNSMGHKLLELPQAAVVDAVLPQVLDGVVEVLCPRAPMTTGPGQYLSYLFDR